MTGELVELGRQGDTRIIWDSEKEDEVATARRAFDDLRAKGYLAFKVNKEGNKGEQITRFDPDAEKLILAPQMKGG